MADDTGETETIPDGISTVTAAHAYEDRLHLVAP